MKRSRKRAISETDSSNNASAAGGGGGTGPARKTHRPDAPASNLAASTVDVSGDKVRLQFNSTPGQVLTLGEGDTGQLGLGDELLSRKRPAKVDSLSNVVQAVAGGMHTVCLTADGLVYTFGCNDEQALGRSTSEEGSEYLPRQVGDGLPDPADDPVVHISAGDSHTAAVTRSGKLFLWGTFRDSNGIIGLTRAKEVSNRPIQLEFPEPGVRVAKTASGACHVVCLTKDGRVFTLGCGEQGQLGRVNERLAGAHGGRTGMQLFLSPREVKIRGSPHFTDVWAGAYVSFARSAKQGAIYAWGLNNYYQLGTGDLENKFFPALATEFSGKQWRELSSGQHHTLALEEATGRVYSIGRGEYGRLGRGPDRQESSGKLEPIGGVLESLVCRQVSCATACSFCVAENGSAYAWGMGSNKQLGHGEEDEDASLPGQIEGKQLDGVRVLSVSGGGQHTVLLVASESANQKAPSAAVSVPPALSASTAAGDAGKLSDAAIAAPAAASEPAVASAEPAVSSVEPAVASSEPAVASAKPAVASSAPVEDSAAPKKDSATPSAPSTAAPSAEASVPPASPSVVPTVASADSVDTTAVSTAAAEVPASAAERKPGN